jgi:hypothetical protein
MQRGEILLSQLLTLHFDLSLRRQIEGRPRPKRRGADGLRQFVEFVSRRGNTFRMSDGHGAKQMLAPPRRNDETSIVLMRWCDFSTKGIGV